MSNRAYAAECEGCDWADYDATSTNEARRHARATGHQTVVTVEQTFIYAGA